MSGQDYDEEIDCGSFFDHIDDLIEFPTVADASLNSVDDNEYLNIWTTNSDELQVSDTVFCGGNGDSASTLSAELAVPYEDIVQLEWLSNFVEDSFSGRGMTINTENVVVEKEAVAADRQHQFQTASPVSVLESSSSSSSSSFCSVGGGGGGNDKVTPLGPIQHGPQRARSKRPRPTTFNHRAMVELLSPMVVMPAPASSVSGKNLASRFGPNSNSVGRDQMKKKMKRPKTQLGPIKENQNENRNQNQIQSGSVAGVRKCMHCEITKTPQWRAGPMGPKTLCNACGVRYKSGRLFPEYRPAASPTFVPSLHSNSHKKVVEMRIKGGPALNDKTTVVRARLPELIPNNNI